MAITTVTPGSSKLRVVKITSECLGPGGVVLYPGKKVRIPEEDAYTLVSGSQAEFAEDTDEKSEK